MNINNAMEQIEEIHKHMSKAEVFHGYKALPVFLSGLAAFAAAYIQVSRKVPFTRLEFIHQWMIIASVIVLLVAASIIIEYIIKGSNFEKRQVYRIFSQFAPSLIIGAVVSEIFIHYKPDALELLPGIWAILFSMGIFAMRPFLPRFIGYVGLFYLVMGGLLLSMNTGLNPWAMGITFGTGNILAALILYMDKVRGDNEKL